MMSSKEFFVRRYEELGWEYKPVELATSIRINTMNAQEDEVLRRLESQGIVLEKIRFVESGYSIRRAQFSVGATAEYLLGLYSIQEAAAQIPATLFTDLKNRAVLDACAAPGGKTVQLADLMQNTGAIVALDIDTRRLTALANHLERCHVKNAVIYNMDARKASQLGFKFDRILLDVPCSGNFVTDKNWFDRRTIKDVEQNATLQRQMLTEAVKVLETGGEIVYSTCSLEPEENELNIDWAVQTLKLDVEEIDCHGEKGLTKVFGKEVDDSVEKCRRIWPESTQGFFVCKLIKRGD